MVPVVLVVKDPLAHGLLTVPLGVVAGEVPICPGVVLVVVPVCPGVVEVVPVWLGVVVLMVPGCPLTADEPEPVGVVVVVLAPGVVVLGEVVVPGVVCVPIVPVPLGLPVVVPLVPGLPAVPVPVPLPVVCAAATPNARNKTDEARKYLAMESPLFNCKFANFGLFSGMRRYLLEMGGKMANEVLTIRDDRHRVPRHDRNA